MSSLRKLFLVGAALIALPVVASAQSSRVEGMALQGDYIKDYTGIFGYPSSITGVGNLVWGEFGNVNNPGGQDRAVGTVLGNLFDGRFGTWGLHISNFTPALGSPDRFPESNTGVPGIDPNFTQNESFDLMWGRKFGTTSLGLRLARTYFKGQDAVADSLGLGNNGRNALTFGGGLGFEMNPNSNVELALLYSSREFENTITATAARLENNNNTNWTVAGRMFWQWQPNVLVVPVAKFWSYDLGTKTTVGGVTTTLDETESGWQIGGAGNWTVGSNDLFVLGLTFPRRMTTSPTTPPRRRRRR